MILESAVIAAGLFSTLAKATATWKRRILDHPWIFEVCCFICLMWWHGATGDGALAATMSTLFLGAMHSVARRIYNVK